MRGVDLEVRPGRHAEAGRRLAQVAQLDTVRSASSVELRILGDELVQAALDVEPRCDAAFRRSRHAGGKRPPCVATPTMATVGSNGSASSTVADDRDAVVALARALRVEDRDHRIGPVADDPAHRLAVVRVVREALAEDEDAPRAAHADGDTPRPGLERGQSAHRRRARRPARGPRASSRLPSRSTWSQSGATQQPAAMPRPDSSMQPSITPRRSARAACAMRIASRIPPDLRELDVDAVRDLGAAGDVGERVAVLVHVDRDRRAVLQRRAHPRRRRAAAARSTRRRARRAAEARRAPRRATTTR